jgi:nucleotide-binding universal stress UspA family protein
VFEGMKLAKRILVATDFSPCSQAAVSYAAGLSKQLGASLVIAHVYFPPVIAVPDAVIPLSANDMRAFLARMQAGLDEAATVAKGLGAASVETALLEGDPWHQVVRCAHDRLCDLIVVGTHGRSAVAHFFLGSVAEKIVRKAECPVLVVRRSS